MRLDDEDGETASVCVTTSPLLFVKVSNPGLPEGNTIDRPEDVPDAAVDTVILILVRPPDVRVSSTENVASPPAPAPPSSSAPVEVLEPELGEVFAGAEERAELGRLVEESRDIEVVVRVGRLDVIVVGRPVSRV